MTIPVLPKLIWSPSPNFDRGRDKDVRLIIVHDCQGNYEGSAQTFLHSQRPHRVSTHLMIKADGTECMQFVDLSDTAWHVANFNDVSVGVEMPGFEAAGFSDTEWQCMADVVAWLLDYYDLPIRWAEKGEGQGYCRHLDLGVEGGNHTDPTTDPAVWDAFCMRLEGTEAQGYAPTWPGLHDGGVALS